MFFHVRFLAESRFFSFHALVLFLSGGACPIHVTDLQGLLYILHGARESAPSLGSLLGDVGGKQ
jgi:hypothetical protein